MWITSPGRGTAIDSPCQMQREYWMHIHAASRARWNIAIPLSVLANPYMKMSATLLMCSTMTTQIIRKIIFIVLVELVVLVQMELPSPSLLLIVSCSNKGHQLALLTLQQTRSRLAILLQYLRRPSSRLIHVSWRWPVMEAAVAVADMVEVDFVAAVVEAEVEVSLSRHPLVPSADGTNKGGRY